MPGSTNIKQFDPNLTNLETDVNYAADALRTGGAAAGVFPKETFNKFAYQVSSFVAALAEMLAAKGYTVNDGSAGVGGNDFTALKAALANMMTAVDKIPTAALADAAIVAADANSILGMKIIRGTVHGSSAIILGTGFTISKPATGRFQINFTSAFSALPTLVASSWGVGGIYVLTGSSSGSVAEVQCVDFNFNLVDSPFNFIAIGPK